MRKNNPVLFGVLSFVLGCGSASVELSDPVEETRIDPEADESPEATPPAPAKPGTISRGDLRELLKEGPGGVLTHILTEPVISGGSFVGFRITAFRRGDPTAVDLRVGDVIQKINGRTIERPEHYYTIFQELAVASEIRFEIVRDGTEQTLIYPVVN